MSSVSKPTKGPDVVTQAVLDIVELRARLTILEQFMSERQGLDMNDYEQRWNKEMARIIARDYPDIT